MADPNANATAQTVADKLDGTVNGQPLPYDVVDMLRPSKQFSLRTGEYPYPEGRNTSASFIDHTNTLTKILSRTYIASDGHEYDAWDMLVALLEWSLSHK